MLERRMNEQAVAIRCRACRKTFTPEAGESGVWVCGHCRGKNPNLARHFRSVADLCVFGLLAALFFLARRLEAGTRDWRTLAQAIHAALFVVTIVLTYRAATPWRSVTIKTLIWVVFVAALALNVGVPMWLSGKMYLPVLAVYGAIFWYLAWLHIQAAKCTPRHP
ncbi:MAG: hypothetical protein JW809_08525 [Pirellulales bacterium]|nr:hypothetical protein [Pirellulales bacterium]